MRRFGARWRDTTTPREVLDVFFIEGRFEILFRNSTPDGEEWADGVEIDPDGYSHDSFELEPYQAARYRFRNGKRRTRWADVPPKVRARVAECLGV